VHGAPELGLLAFDLTHRHVVAVRQPGERRDLRVGHSVGNEYLLAFGVIRNRMRVADH
jgi:hypothetical protein